MLLNPAPNNSVERDGLQAALANTLRRPSRQTLERFKGGPPVPFSRYSHPHRGIGAALIEWVANSERIAAVRRCVLSRLPFLQLQSDVVDVVYLTWLVPTAKARRYVPDALELWQRDGLTPFSILTYRHQHFGPALLGPLRKVFASPIQSNWRLYLRDVPDVTPDGRVVLFTHNLLSNLLYVLGARTMSDALPADLPAKFVHQVCDGTYTTEVIPGSGSSPPLTARVRRVDTAALPSAFERVFKTWREAVEFLALQDAAVAEAKGTQRLAYAEIELPIDAAKVLATEAVQVSCPVVEQLEPVGPPLCFVVPKVPFRVRSERLLLERSNPSVKRTPDGAA